MAVETASHEPEWIQRIRRAGEELPEDLAAQALSQGEAAVEPLIALLLDPDAADVDKPGEGWGAIHAAVLLTGLKDRRAIEPFLDVLAETEWDAILHDVVVQGLSTVGSPVVEPALARLPDAGTDEFESLVVVLADSGVKDERIHLAIVELAEENPGLGALAFASYGDPADLPFLERVLREFDTSEGPAEDTVAELKMLVEAYERLRGSPMDEELRTHVDRLIAAVPLPVRRAEPKIGRNDPCDCGSGEKYKKCHGAKTPTLH
jgi:hypothetical protein